VIKLKKKVFQDLKQGSMSVNEYVTKFTQLSHYAPHEVDTNEKKQEYFLNDLNDGLAYALEAQDFENFQRMVNKAVETSDIMPTDAPINAHVPITLLMLHLPPLVEPILFRLLPSKTMPVGGSTMLLWRKPKKLQTWSLVCFLSTLHL
jgi:hypothetical protein